MTRKTFRSTVGLAVLAMLIGLSGPAFGAGFSIFEQGTKAMGMAGAFTAQADDGSAMFHNVGGLAFLKDKSYEVGVTLISPSSEYRGGDPFPGTDAFGEQESAIFTPLHFYYVHPLNERITLGLGFNSPFGLTTEWENPESWPGRYISSRAELLAFDFNPSIGYQLTPKIGVGFGAVIRASKVELDQYLPSVDPFTQRVVDVGLAELESDFTASIGWNTGILHKVNSYLTWGFSFRSAIETDYDGDALFTQISTGNAALDAVVAQTLPFGVDLPIETSIETPSIMSLGVALNITEKLLVELDINRTDWTSFDEVLLEFTESPELTRNIGQAWDDAYHYRIGFRLDLANDRQLRFGYVVDETPQPESSVGPLLPDANRKGYTIGYGFDRLDVAAMYVDFSDRTTLTNSDNFFGTYETSVWLLAGTYKF